MPKHRMEQSRRWIRDLPRLRRSLLERILELGIGKPFCFKPIELAGGEVKVSPHGTRSSRKALLQLELDQCYLSAPAFFKSLLGVYLVQQTKVGWKQGFADEFVGVDRARQTPG